MQLPLRDVFCEPEELEAVRVLEGLLREFGLRGGKRPVEVGERLALAPVEPGVDLGLEDGPAPAVLDAGPGVPLPLGGVLDLVEEPQVVAPGDLCNGLLHDRLLGPGGGEGPHVLEVAGREARHLRERLPEVAGELVDDLGSPAPLLLPQQDVPADAPVEQDELAVDGERGLDARGADAPLELLEELAVAVWRRGEVAAHPSSLPRTDSGGQGPERTAWTMAAIPALTCGGDARPCVDEHPKLLVPAECRRFC